MKHQKLISLLLAFATAASMLIGCSSSTPTSTTTSGAVADTGTTTGEAAADTSAAGNEKDVSDITIAYVTNALTTQIFRDQVTAMEAYSDEIGCEFVYTAVDDMDAQLAAIDNYIAMGADCLIVHVTSVEAFEDSMKNCQAAGIPFFAYDTNIEGSDAYYGWDNYEMGYAIGSNAAEWVNANFSAGDTVYAASNDRKIYDFLVIREQGYKDALEELCDATIEWVIEAPGGNTERGVTAGENFIQCGYDLNLVCAINDSGLCGVYQAFQAANYGEGKTLGLFGCDSDPEALDAIAEGGIYKGTINTGLVSLAPEFIDIAIGLATGDESVRGEHLGDFVKITEENVQDWR